MNWWYVAVLIGKFNELKARTAELNRRQAQLDAADREAAEVQRRWAITKSKNVLRKYGRK